MASQVKKVKRSVAVVREDAFGLKRKELEKAVEEQQKRIKTVEDEVAQANNDVSDFNKQLMLAKEQAGQLQQDIEMNEKMAKELMEQKEDLMKQQQEFSALAQDGTEAFKQEILDAQMRKQALAASVDVVHKKYEAGADNVQDFNKEKADLGRYLEVLIKENMNLKKKLSL